jgi:hypothetical protein
MPVPYGPDLSQFTLARLRQIVESGDLLPSHRILGEHVAERFAVLEAHGIQTLADILDRLKTKPRLAQFAAESGLPEDYLVILRRKANGYVPNPANLADIPGVAADHAQKLAAIGIKHTRHLFERGLTPAGRAALAAESGVPPDAILELVQLADIVRAGYVGPVYARLIHLAGARDLPALAAQDPAAFFARLCAVNVEHQFTKARFTQKDIAATIAMAQEIPAAIVY